MLIPHASHEETRAQFRWQIPEHYNIGVDICDRWAAGQPDRTAIIDVQDDGRMHKVSFGALQRRSNQLANALRRYGVSGLFEMPDGIKVGDRVGVLLPQAVETAQSHIAVTKMGAVSMPLSILFGDDALRHRLAHSAAKAVITNADGAQKLARVRSDLPALQTVLSVDGALAGAECYHQAIADEREDFAPASTRADDPAILIYTSGTTGPPKGALHAHRVLLGHLPGVEISHNFLPQAGDILWSPADWAWIGGLLDVLMPGLHHGVPVVASRFGKFTADAAFDLIKSSGIRNVFLPPTALKLMRQHPDPERFGLQLRSVASGGEPLGSGLLAWGERVFKTSINEFYGQTECNMVVSSCGVLEPALPGVMGRPVPGHKVAIIDPKTGVLPDDGDEGEIAVRHPDPVMFLGYWQDERATAAKFVDGPTGRWLLTGDRGRMEGDGRIRFIARGDDVITSAGYRIGPGEVEDCLMTHPAVSLAGVVGKPDPVRGSLVAAFVVLTSGFDPSDDLATELSDHVKQRLSAHEYPRLIRFIDAMPMTTTGKVIRAKLRAKLLRFKDD